ncbi:hypothetical protein HDV05_006466 [Chytridiales sp. JEL 0842]|nr:hypothetical protein HDV05_006466 [Chytridiales sp. JEL 0842]
MGEIRKAMDAAAFLRSEARLAQSMKPRWRSREGDLVKDKVGLGVSASTEEGAEENPTSKDLTTSTTLKSSAEEEDLSELTEAQEKRFLLQQRQTTRLGAEVTPSGAGSKGIAHRTSLEGPSKGLSGKSQKVAALRLGHAKDDVESYKTPTQLLWEDYLTTRPTLSSLDSLIDSHYNQAVRRGDFDNLPGRGKPLNLSEDTRMNPYLDDTSRSLNTMIRKGGHSLPWIEKRKEVDADIESMRGELRKIYKECFQSLQREPNSSSVGERGGALGKLARWIEGRDARNSRSEPKLSPEELEKKQKEEWKTRGGGFAEIRVEEINIKIRSLNLQIPTGVPQKLLVSVENELKLVESENSEGETRTGGSALSQSSRSDIVPMMTISRSRWTLLPVELKSRIFKFTGPLTRYLNRDITHPPPTDQESTEIWLAAFELDWKGDLTKLPFNGFPDVFNGLCNVQSREMYDNLCRTMPDLCFEGSMNDILLVCNRLNKGKEYATGLLKTASRSLINIAIRRRWEDKLVDVTPLVSDIYSCYFVIEDAAVDATARLRRTMPHLFADSAEGTLINWGYRMSAWDTDADGNLWLYNKNYISFEDLEDRFSYAQLLNLCLKSPSLISDIKAFLSDILFDADLSGLYEDTVKLIIENEFVGYDTTMWIDIVAANHSLELLQYIHNRFPLSATTQAMDEAARHGCLENLKFLHYNRSEGCTVRAMGEAAANGHLEVVKFLHTNRTEGCTTSALDSAAYNGHLEVLQFLHENRSEGCTTNAMDWAGMNGHLEVVEFLNMNRSEGGTLSGAFESVRKGHDAVAKYLLESCKLSDENVNYNFFSFDDARNLMKNDIYKTLLDSVPKLAKSIFSIGLDCGHTDMVDHALNVSKVLSSSTAFLKYLLVFPHLLDPTYVMSELIASTNAKEFGKSLIIATSSALDWDLLTVQNNTMLLGIVLPAANDAKNRLKGVCSKLVQVLTFKGRLDHRSMLFKDVMEFLRLLGRAKA